MSYATGAPIFTSSCGWDRLKSLLAALGHTTVAAADDELGSSYASDGGAEVAVKHEVLRLNLAKEKIEMS